MKRPPGLWILLSAGLLCLSLQHVYGLKATELIFRKTTSTSSTTDASPDGDTSKDSASTEIAETAENATLKSNLTGNPQLDYIYDPNLPRELNGYNLSTYPFYNGMPEEINFKCDGLHDGFYASVEHKCQVYHHCLFGTRFDFLCANYTAFDQKTFICHFASEVDCINSPKFWHRNDALYQAASTTTLKPVPISISPALTVPRKPPPAARRRRPARRRPQYEYYDDDYEEEDRDDYYEEPPRRRRKRPRPRPRPVYDDDDDDYEDDRTERRGTGRRNEERRESPDRRKEMPHDRREYDDRRRYKDDRRREYDDRTHNDKDDGTDYKTESDRKKENERKRKPTDMGDEENHRYETGRKKEEERKRKPMDADVEGNHRYETGRRKEEERKRKPMDSDDEDYDRYETGRRKEEERKRKPLDVTDEENHRYDRRRPTDDTRYEQRPRGSRRPYDDNSNEDDGPRNTQEVNGQALVKPNSSSSIFNQPRMAPRIRPPVPKNEQSKFAYKSTTAAAPKKSTKDDQYDDYDYDLPPQRPQQKVKPEPELRPERKPAKANSDRDNRRGTESRQRPQIPEKPARTYDYDDDEEDKVKPVRPQMKTKQEIFSRDSKINSRNRATTEDSSDFDLDDYSRSRERSSNTKLKPKEPPKSKNEERETTPATFPSTSTTKEPLREYQENVRIVKRPFLPSRGGNPFSARGLQPVGAKALDITRQDAEASTEQAEQTHSFAEETSEVHNSRQFPSEANPSRFQYDETTSDGKSQSPMISQQQEEVKNSVPEKEEEFKPPPVVVKVVNRFKYINPIENESREFKPLPNHHQTHIRQKSKEYNNNTPRKNPLDISESEYDVTLNDALNPTLPNLPIRSFPTGFSATNDYYNDNYNRPRYDLNYNRAQESRFQARAPSEKVETIAEAFNTEGRRYVGVPPDPIYQYRANPQVTQAQAHGFYTVY